MYAQTHDHASTIVSHMCYTQQTRQIKTEIGTGAVFCVGVHAEDRNVLQERQRSVTVGFRFVHEIALALLRGPLHH